MRTRVGTCPSCGGSAVFQAGRGACLSSACRWRAAVLSDLDPERPALVEDLPVGMHRVRVERIGPADYCWSVYTSGEQPTVHGRGRCVSRNEAWRDVLRRIPYGLG